MLGNSPIADLSTTQWHQVVAASLSREYAIEQIIEKPSNFAIWLIDSGGVCITRGQERHYYQQGQIMAVDGMMGEFSVSNNTRLLCLDGPALQSLSETCLDSANIVYNLAAKQQFQSEVLELIEQYCGPLRLAHRTEILAACQWQSVAPGDVLVNRGERCFHWHIVLHGKLCGMRRSISQSDVDHQWNKTFEQHIDMYRLRGDCFGQTALLGNGEYQMAFVAKTAVRLVKFKRDIFDLLWQHYDNFKQIIATELAMSHASPLHPEWGDKIAVANLSEFTQSQEVLDSLAQSSENSCELIDFERLAQKLGLPLAVGHMVRHPGWYSVYRWWKDNLDKDMLLDSDSRYPAWQGFCTANANRIIGLLDGALAPQNVQSELLAPRFGIERWLLICHQSDVEQPQGTIQWLTKFADPKFLHWRFNHDFDSARVLRTIKGEAVTLSLCGCYRAAVAKIGVLKQMQAQGFQADMVVGSGFSMLLAAFYALDLTIEQIYQRMVINPHDGIKGLRFGRLVSKDTMVFRHIFNDNFRKIGIEDMWIPFACRGFNDKQQPTNIVRGKLRHILKQLDTRYYPPSTQASASLANACRYRQAKVVAIDVIYAKNKSGSHLSRWFNKDNGQLQGQFESTLQREDVEAIGDDGVDSFGGKPQIQWLTLQLRLPEHGVHNQYVLENLIRLGVEQSKPLIGEL